MREEEEGEEQGKSSDRKNSGGGRPTNGSKFDLWQITHHKLFECGVLGKLFGKTKTQLLLLFNVECKRYGQQIGKKGGIEWPTIISDHKVASCLLMPPPPPSVVLAHSRSYYIEYSKTFGSLEPETPIIRYCKLIYIYLVSNQKKKKNMCERLLNS